MSASRDMGRLDAELSHLLDVTLSDSTKSQLEAMRGRGVPSGSMDEEPDSPLAEVVPTSPANADPEHARLRRPDVLASIIVGDGAFHFLGVPEHGEIGLSFSGDCGDTFNAIVQRFPSPLRLYASVAPLDAPIPWPIAAVDHDQEDRLDLVGARRFCDRVEDALPARLGSDGEVQLQAPTESGGIWTPDPTPAVMMPVAYCAPITGRLLFHREYCEAEWDPGPASEWNIIKCSSALNKNLTHTSESGGDWRRRRCSTSHAWVCDSPVYITHLYWEAGNWLIAEHGQFGQFGPSKTAPFKSPWQGLVRRFRMVEYRHGLAATTGGFRAYSFFSRHLDLHG